MVYENNQGNDITALQNISIDIKKGEFVSLLGPSGCGKTTLLRSVADLLKPSSGNTSISGQTPAETRLSQKYGMVFQNPVLYEWRTVRNNIRMPLEIMKIPRIEQNRRLATQLEMIGLKDFENCYPRQLSGGMQQRVGIARALVIQPEILLMDEPLSALYELTKEKLHEDLLRIWSKTNKTVLFVTHNIVESVFLSDRVCVFFHRIRAVYQQLWMLICRVPVRKRCAHQRRHSIRFQKSAETLRESTDMNSYLSRKKLAVSIVAWVMDILILWELTAFLLVNVLNDPMAEKSFPTYMKSLHFSEYTGNQCLLRRVLHSPVQPNYFWLVKDMNTARTVIAAYMTFSAV